MSYGKLLLRVRSAGFRSYCGILLFSAKVVSSTAVGVRLYFGGNVLLINLCDRHCILRLPPHQNSSRHAEEVMFTKRRNRRRKMLVESLESRELLTGSLIDSSGVLQLTGTEQAERIIVKQGSYAGRPTVDVTYNGAVERWYLSDVTANKIYYNGLGGDDYCRNDVSTLRLEAWGGSGKDSLIGDEMNDFLVGGAGDDWIYGFGGNDSLRGDLDGTSGRDNIDGGNGDDSIYGGPLNDKMVGGAGNDRLYGEDGNDRIYGDAGDDRIWGGNGIDNIWGDNENGAAGIDQIYGEGGDDVLRGGDLADSIFGGNDSDRLEGGNGDDILDGQAGNDIIYGGSQYDMMYGGDGDDFLDGQGEDGWYHGGKGNDMVASQLVINGAKSSDIRQAGSTSCWYLATLGAFADRAATTANYISYVGLGTYSVRVYSRAQKTWTEQPVVFQGASHAGDAQVISNGATNLDVATCEGETWATIMHRGMLQFYGIDYTKANAVTNANFGYGAGVGGYSLDAFWLLGVTTGKSESPVQSTTKADTAFISRMRSLLMRTNPGQPMLAASFGRHPKMISAHCYQITAIGTDGTVTLRNPWGRDGGRTIENADDGIVTLTALEFTTLMSQITYTTAIMST
jgi:Ca2+-binding RTX toxin-like protein